MRHDAMYTFSDVSAQDSLNGGSLPQSAWEDDFRASAWFTRGWTLQELLAPSKLQFFSFEGLRLGDKKSLEQIVCEVTNLPAQALQGAPLSTFRHQDRRLWAISRQTTEPEDKAYCLLGIHEVSMPSNYGEGLDSAMERLDEQCEKSARRLQPTVLGKRSLSDRDDISEHLPFDHQHHNGRPQLDDEAKSRLMESLKFDQIDARHMSIRKAHARTCQWLMEDSKYQAWMDSADLHRHHGFIWIKGKPGSGKSTIMKFALASAQKRLSEVVVLSFFFNARGNKLERSTVGAYRALLVQLLTKLPHLQSVFDSLDTAASRIDEDYQWSIETLKELLSECLQGLGPRSVILFIDALDECDEQEIRDMISFFEEASEQNSPALGQIRICLASRYYPHITIKSGLSLELDKRAGHTRDIETYLSNELKIGKSKTASQIRADLLEKASGIFMWIVLVVGILNKEYDSGQMIGLRKRLVEIPSDLSALFRDILCRDSSNKAIMLTCIQWILFAKTPLSPTQLYLAIRSGIESEPPTLSAQEPIEDGLVQRFILSASKGLAEVTRSVSPTVQFIHESVRDFLLNQDGIVTLWPELSGQVLKLSHDRLNLCCGVYLQHDALAATLNGIEASVGEAYRTVSTERKAVRASISNEFPFLAYAANHVLHHADACIGAGGEPEEFLRRFEFYQFDWRRVLSMFAIHETQKADLDQEDIYIFAQRGYRNILHHTFQEMENMGVGKDHFRDVLERAVQRTQLSAVQTLLEGSDMIPQHFTSPLAKRSFMKCMSKQREKIAVLLFNTTALGLWQDSDLLKNGLTKAAQSGLQKVIPLLATKYAELDGRSAVFEIAIATRSPDLVELILQKWASNMSMTELRATLIYAACDSSQILRLLLPVDAQTVVNYDALAKCCTHLKASRVEPDTAYDVCQLLIKFGAFSKLQSAACHTALYAACACGSEDLVLQLFDKGLVVSKDVYRAYQELEKAAERRLSGEVMKVLVQQLRNHALETIATPVFELACKFSNKRMAEILLQNGLEMDLTDAETAFQTLDTAVSANWDETVPLALLRQLSQPALQASYLNSIYDIAFGTGRRAIVQLLLDQGLCSSNRNVSLYAGPTVAAGDLMINPDNKLVQLFVCRSLDLELDVKALLSSLLHTCLLAEDTVLTLTGRYGACYLHPFIIRRPLSDWGDVCIAEVVTACRASGDTLVISETDSVLPYGVQVLGPLFLHACRRMEKDMVRVLLEMGVGADFGESNGNTALQRAAGYDQTGHIIDLLLEHQASVEAGPCSNFGTPLYEACCRGPIQNVRLLVEKGARIHGSLDYYQGFDQEKDLFLDGMSVDDFCDPRPLHAQEEELLLQAGVRPKHLGERLRPSYQYQLMLLERQNRLRLAMKDKPGAELTRNVRQEQESSDG